MDNDDELLRLRHRCHKLESDCAALVLRYGYLQRQVNRLQRIVNKMDTADQIAEAVSLRVNTNRKLRLTWVQWGIAALIALPGTIDVILHLTRGQ